ncbi:unnamed protein product [Allacma fusca]|uniref:Uncharacterized protein n=1 Tax=Allacma fusca TaxID=39272 RepID=A0A8J2JK07_9HEXA|nr:unnamed protein product [Allacma fusca]
MRYFAALSALDGKSLAERNNRMLIIVKWVAGRPPASQVIAAVKGKWFLKKVAVTAEKVFLGRFFYKGEWNSIKNKVQANKPQTNPTKIYKYIADDPHLISYYAHGD